MSSAVANRYARALVDVVMASGSQIPPEHAVAQVRAVAEMVAGSAESLEIHSRLAPRLLGSCQCQWSVPGGKLDRQLPGVQIFLTTDH